MQSNFVLESFKKSINSNQLIFTAKLKHLYDFFLEEHHVYQVNAAIINSMLMSPFFMEMKLKLIEKNAELMDYDTTITLLKGFEDLLEEMQGNPRHNFLISNTSPLMIILLCFRITLKILKNFPHLDIRVKNYHDMLISTLVKFSESTKMSPLFVLQQLKQRDYTGRSLIDMLIETKVYMFT